MLTIGVLASGQGTNLQALIDAIKEGYLPGRIGVVISDNPQAYALERAKKAGIPAFYLPPGPRKTYLVSEVEKQYVECLVKHQVQLVCLAGFMRVIKRTFLSNFPNRIINIHPSLLPAFPGLEAWKQALDYGVKFTGCTTHFVNEYVDAGKIILQAVVPVLPDDTPESLHRRIQEKEHFIYPLSVKLIAQGQIKYGE
ncbi:MAG: phosphoribosylglycinamide formyltransferase [Candidatus Omnitrophica bacterium]|nr:phosphoribosylglycinamide formyltransferase [Candidatus Omnitrophota bacterium]